MSQTPAVPADTTPTWEIELLISGALVFATAQLPSLFDDLLLYWLPRLPGGLAQGISTAYVLGKSVALLLAITFGLHVLLRGFWAAALGLKSVFPQGILWDRVRSGPYFREALESRVATLPAYVSRLDNLASTVFALGAVVVLLTGLSGAAVGAMVAAAATASWLVLGRVPDLGPYFLVPMLLITPPFIGSFVDRRFGARIARDGWAGRVMRLLARLNSRVSGASVVAPMMLVFTSRTGELRGTLGLIGIVYGVFAIVVLQFVALFDIVNLDGYSRVPETGPAVLHPQHYADQRREELAFSRAPFLPSDVVRGRTLRLLVPYYIDRFDSARDRWCTTDAASPAGTESMVPPGAIADTAARGQFAALACLGNLLAPRIDGAPLTGTWRFATDPASDLRGLLLVADLGDLPLGPHLLTLQRLPLPRERLDSTDVYSIPFWLEPREPAK